MGGCGEGFWEVGEKTFGRLWRRLLEVLKILRGSGEGLRGFGGFGEDVEKVWEILEDAEEVLGKV